MALYRTAQGFGVDYRDEFGRRHRKFVGAEEAARRLDRLLREQTLQVCAWAKRTPCAATTWITASSC